MIPKCSKEFEKQVCEIKLSILSLFFLTATIHTAQMCHSANYRYTHPWQHTLK